MGARETTQTAMSDDPRSTQYNPKNVKSKILQVLRGQQLPFAEKFPPRPTISTSSGKSSPPRKEPEIMPNITVAVSEQDYRAARVWAAARGTSVSAVVRRVLENLPSTQEDLPARIASLAGEMSRPEPRLDRRLLPLRNLVSGSLLNTGNSPARPPNSTRPAIRHSAPPRDSV